MYVGHYHVVVCKLSKYVGTVERLNEAKVKEPTMAKWVLPDNCRFVLVPVLMILVIPFYVYIPRLQQQQLLDLVNKTIQASRNGA